MRTLGIIPARAGSKRLAGKNWRRLGDRPLAAYAMNAAAASELLTEVVVTSDSEEVLALAHGYSTFHCILRPAALSTDTSLAIEYVRHALTSLAALGHPPYDAIAIIQPSSPFTLADDIDGTIRLLIDTGADSAVSITEIPHDLNPIKLKTLAPDHQLEPYFEPENGRMAAHQLPQAFIRNGSVYASTMKTITSGAIIGPDCRGYLMPRERSVDINDTLDWKLAELLLQERKNTDA